ncbi:hypothetical protein DF185_16275 [Marinifilum breve]|uniref:STAS/SEC14 domain-containing protein n=1 Tax=Marinifilum breve TaxID=2184082 RepID=A0A2V3ZVM2_9BACT|nr:hypothetical protein [Marinifilum breve]PXX98929.1 hypothetical protein DF185_16275 [Marinifilum breve]
MSCEIKWVGNNAYVRFFGTLSINDFHMANGKIYGSRKFDNMNFQIADFSDVEEIKLTDEEVVTISTLELTATRWNRCVKVAHVSKNEELRNLVRVYENQMSNTNWTCKLFEYLDEAENWCKEE